MCRSFSVFPFRLFCDDIHFSNKVMFVIPLGYSHFGVIYRKHSPGFEQMVSPSLVALPSWGNVCKVPPGFLGDDCDGAAKKSQDSTGKRAPNNWQIAQVKTNLFPASQR